MVILLRARDVLCISLLGMFTAACTSAPKPIANAAPASPPKDDGKASKGGDGGKEHAEALEQLKTAVIGFGNDKQRSFKMPLADASHWTSVKFWGVPSLAGFRYGKAHHAIAGAFVTHVADNREPGACSRSFEEWAKTYIDAFDVRLVHQPPQAVVWKGHIVEIASIDAKSAMLADQDDYRATYAAFPAWNNACIVAGMAVPGRGEVDRATDVRDRFAKEILPLLEIVAKEEPKERY